VSEDQLRALIREAVARHLGGASAPVVSAAVSRPEVPVAAFQPPPANAALHVSHYQYLALVNVGDACVIEPAVTCNHCGYCRSHGH
jgi:hypothetical protein